MVIWYYENMLYLFTYICIYIYIYVYTYIHGDHDSICGIGKTWMEKWGGSHLCTVSTGSRCTWIALNMESSTVHAWGLRSMPVHAYIYIYVSICMYIIIYTYIIDSCRLVVSSPPAVHQDLAKTGGQSWDYHGNNMKKKWEIWKIWETYIREDMEKYGNDEKTMIHEVILGNDGFKLI